MRKRRALLCEYHLSSPFARITVDVVGPFRETDAGNKNILVVVDYFSKLAETYARPNQGANESCRCLGQSRFCRFGVQMELKSDQGKYLEFAVSRRLRIIRSKENENKQPYNLS